MRLGGRVEEWIEVPIMGGRVVDPIWRCLALSPDMSCGVHMAGWNRRRQGLFLFICWRDANKQHFCSLLSWTFCVFFVCHWIFLLKALVFFGQLLPYWHMEHQIRHQDNCHFFPLHTLRIWKRPPVTSERLIWANEISRCQQSPQPLSDYWDGLLW